jgi:hypothetical protein
MKGSAPFATNDDFARFFDVGDDTRRALLRAFGMPKRRKHAETEIWNAIGLEPDQPEEVRNELMCSSGSRIKLWGPSRVAEENRWCRQRKYPEGFPLPVVDLGTKRRWWLPIDVRAYLQPSIYGDLARMIQRKSASKPPPPETVEWNGTLQPLPPQDPAPMS